MTTKRPTETQLRNIKQGMEGWFFPTSGHGQSRSCDFAEQHGWLEGQSILHSTTFVDGQKIDRYKRAFRATKLGKKIINAELVVQ